MLAITGNGEEEEAPLPKKRARSQKGKKKGVKALSHAAVIRPDPEAKRKSISHYRTRSQAEISLCERAKIIKKTGWFCKLS